MKTINFLFGWLVKPELLQTPLDSLICIIEFFVIVPIAIRIVLYIKDTIDKFKIGGTKAMNKKIYKGYQLIKAIADGEIKERNRIL